MVGLPSILPTHRVSEQPNDILHQQLHESKCTCTESLDACRSRLISTDDHENVEYNNKSSHNEWEHQDIKPTTSMVDEQELFEWENPSYLVKDLDTGEAYHVEEIDQQFNLVTLDTVAKQLETNESSSLPSSTNEVASSAYLLSLYSSDETMEMQVEDDEYPHDGQLSRTRSANFSIDSEDVLDHREPTTCEWTDCSILHQRSSGFCVDHEILAKEQEDSRAQTLYLIPLNACAELVQMKNHGFVYDASNRLYTVYVLELYCSQSQANWCIYRRYQEFKTLNDTLRPLGIRVPLLPPKKLMGSFDPDFIAKRQSELAEWLRQLLTHDPNDASAKNPHELEVVRTFLTSKADQPPPCLLERLPLKRSRFFGTSLLEEEEEKKEKLIHPPPPHATLQDFKMIQVIGRGSFGKVVLVGHKESKKLFAMKILSKENIVKRKQVEHTRTERRVLGYTTHPFIVRLHYAFQTPQRLYFVLDYCPGGELFYHLSRMKKLPEHMACFYAAEITLALEHLHSLGVVYRDLKPENILLTKEGHIKLADFGLAKEGIYDGVYGTNSLCGTPEYLPPEILDRLGHGTAVDWWNLGMVLYEMLTGLPPWYTNDRKKLFERLRGARLHFPPYVSRRAEALIRQLLNRNPAERAGAKGAYQVKNHLFFETIDWAKLMKKQIPPPFRPCHSAMNDGEAPLNFEAEFTRLPLPSIEGIDIKTGENNRMGTGDTVPEQEIKLVRTDSDTFRGFTYENPSFIESLRQSNSINQQDI